MSQVTLRLLGGFTAFVGGEAVPDRAFRLKKARELVKLLALAPGHRLHREQAMDTLWRDLDPAAAANNLNQAVYVARRALGADVIDVRQELLVLDAAVDADDFERAAADARRAAAPSSYRAALTLYRGELLPENRYDDWAERAGPSWRRCTTRWPRSWPRFRRTTVSGACRRTRARSSGAGTSWPSCARCSTERAC